MYLHMLGKQEESHTWFVLNSQGKRVANPNEIPRDGYPCHTLKYNRIEEGKLQE